MVEAVAERFEDDFDWLVFLGEDAAVDADLLIQALSKHKDPRRKEVLLGHGLYDQEWIS